MEYQRKVNHIFNENLAADLFFSFCAEYSRWGKADRITDRERAILEELFQGCSTKEIGLRYGLTGERIRQLANKGVYRLKKAMRDSVFVLKEDYDAQLDELRRENEFLRNRIKELECDPTDKRLYSSEVVHILTKRLRECNISVRLMNVLIGQDIETLEDLMRFTPAKLKKVRCMGKKSYNELMDFINSCGLQNVNGEYGNFQFETL